jgi:hypothetical protein
MPECETVGQNRICHNPAVCVVVPTPGDPELYACGPCRDWWRGRFPDARVKPLLETPREPGK